MTYRAVTCNAHGPSPRAKNEATIKAASSRADVLCVQEADSEVRAAVRALPDFDYYIAPSNARVLPIAWREDLFDKVDAGWWRIMVNKPGVKDGPDRFMVWVLLREKATGQVVVHVNVHLIHQAFTRAKHRKPQWVASVAALGVRVAQLIARHRAPVVICGDWNRPSKFDIPGIDERELSSPATFGKRSPVLRYDRFFVVGKATLRGAVRFDTPSDHHSLQTTVTLTSTATPPAPTPAPTPAPAPEVPAMKIHNLGIDTSGRPLRVDDRTLRKLRAAEARLGHTFTIVQGSFRAGEGAAASAATHDRAGVVDLRTWNLPPGTTPQEAVRALREAGLIAWYRTSAQGFDPHIHAIDYGNPNLHPSAQRQVDSWAAGRNGLASNGVDDGPRVHIPKDPPAPAPEKDWFDMATENDLRKIVREELRALLGDVITVPPNETDSYIKNAGKGQTVQFSSALTRMWRHLIDVKEK